MTVGRESWNRVFVQKVLDTHNSAYHLNFLIHGRTEELYPELLGQQLNNWDWVCRDEAFGVEAAVEEKKLTRELAEQTHSELTKVGQRICAEVRDKLRSVFSLSVDLLTPDFKVGHSAQRKRLVERLAGFVIENGKELPGDKTRTTRVEAGDQLSVVLPAGTWLHLYRGDPSKLKPDARELNYLQVNFDCSEGFAATQTLAGDELCEFRSLIAKANKQLGVAKQKGIPETLLVLVEISHSGADADALESTVRILPRAEYGNIDHIYLVGFTPAQRIGGTANPPTTGSAVGPQ